MFSPTAITRSVIGGRGRGAAYRGTAAAQSSLKKGSSEGDEMSAGRWVWERARWVERERRGRG